MDFCACLVCIYIHIFPTSTPPNKISEKLEKDSYHCCVYFTTVLSFTVAKHVVSCDVKEYITLINTLTVYPSGVHMHRVFTMRELLKACNNDTVVLKLRLCCSSKGTKSAAAHALVYKCSR